MNHPSEREAHPATTPLHQEPAPRRFRLRRGHRGLPPGRSSSPGKWHPLMLIPRCPDSFLPRSPCRLRRLHRVPGLAEIPYRLRGVLGRNAAGDQAREKKNARRTGLDHPRDRQPPRERGPRRRQHPNRSPRPGGPAGPPDTSHSRHGNHPQSQGSHTCLISFLFSDINIRFPLHARD